MFSTTKVMTLLLTSLLIFLAIELMDMRDPTEFRERFAAYKEGKMPYENGLPKYARGKRGHIGGTTKLAREAVWNVDSVLSNAVDSIANAYGLHDGALRHRLDLEGFTDRVINLYNAASDQSQYIGENLLNNKYDFSGIGHFGLDDAATMIGNGQMQLKGETWWDEDGENEKGRITKGAVGDTVRDTIGLLAAALKHFSDEVKKDFPNLSSYDNARYTQAYYLRGAAGGRKWAKSGAKGYNFATKPLAMRLADDPYKITTNIQNTAAPKFGSYKNGKLPGYKIGHNVSNAKLNEDGTFTDDYTKVFEDMYVTPQKTDLKRGSYTLNNFPYYLQHRTDWMKPFMSSATNEKGLETISPEFDALMGIRAIQQLSKPFTKVNLGNPELKPIVFEKVPKSHKYLSNSGRNYGVRINYKSPQENLLTVEQLDLMLGEYLGHGAERMVFEDRRNPNRVIKIGNGLNAEADIRDFDALNEAVEYALEMNKLPGTVPMSYEGFIEEGGKFIPWFSQLKVIPMKKMADPWYSFTKPHILPNGKQITKGKLATIRYINDAKTVNKLGYERNSSKSGFYNLPGYPYLVGDFGEKNMGFDELGNLKIFDPLIEL